MTTKKSLGQHWLYDVDSLELVLAGADLQPSDTVLEVGPGTGSLTKLLASRVEQVVAVEKDAELIDELRQLSFKNITVLQQDILDFDLTKLPPNYKVVANIPYYLTSALLRQLLESQNHPKLMSLLVQKEVAERVCAIPGAMSVLAFSIQYFAESSIEGVVEKDKFEPPPKVDSAVLQLKTRAKPYFAADTKKLFRLVKAGFGERRKQLKNSLAGGLHISPSIAALLLREASLDDNMRAQELSLSQWGDLYQAAQKQNLL